jgi:hypothetical protein
MRGLRCDIVPCTLDAWRQAHLDAGGVLRDALDEGIVLYANPGRVEALLEVADGWLLSFTTYE